MDSLLNLHILTMAKLAVNLTVIFSLFILSQARMPFNLPANEFRPSVTSSSESDTTVVYSTIQTIHLPSDKSEVDHADPIGTLSKSDPSVINVVGVSQPLNYVRFRPINRHFDHTRINRPLWYGHHHRCRHNHHLHIHHGEIPYGNDMLMAGDETKFSQNFHGEAGQVPISLGKKYDHHRHGKRFRFPGKDLVVKWEALTEGLVKKFEKLLSNYF